MASSVPSKIFIKVESTTEQQENLKNSRKSSRTLGVLQKTGTVDKENLVGRQPAFITKEQLIKKTIERFVDGVDLFCFLNLNFGSFSDNTQTPDGKRKIPSQNTASTSSQTSPSLEATGKTVTAEDLTSEHAGEAYWEVLAEKRRAALEESLVENQELYERIATLEDELNQSKSLLAETRSLVEVLTEMLEEKEGDATTEDATTNATPKTDPTAVDEDISD